MKLQSFRWTKQCTSLCGKKEYKKIYIMMIAVSGLVRRSIRSPRRARGRPKSRALAMAEVKYQCQGWVPHSALLFDSAIASSLGAVNGSLGAVSGSPHEDFVVQELQTGKHLNQTLFADRPLDFVEFNHGAFTCPLKNKHCLRHTKQSIRDFWGSSKPKECRILMLLTAVHMGSEEKETCSQQCWTRGQILQAKEIFSIGRSLWGWRLQDWPLRQWSHGQLQFWPEDPWAGEAWPNQKELPGVINRTLSPTILQENTLQNVTYIWQNAIDEGLLPEYRSFCL